MRAVTEGCVRNSASAARLNERWCATWMNASNWASSKGAPAGRPALDSLVVEEEVCVDFDEAPLVSLQRVLIENRGHRASQLARSAVDALVRVDEILLGIVR